MRLAYLNGRYLPEEEAFVPALDRGFIFGDAVYEMVPVYAGSPIALERHVARLQRSLEALEIRPALDLAAELGPICAGLYDRNGPGDFGVYCQVTRGVAPRDHAPPTGLMPTVFARVSPLSRRPAEPVAAVTHEDLRWRRCDIKATALLANVLARIAAQREAAFEAILVRDDQVTEGAASNVFVVVDGEVLTPPEGPQMLSGITRELVLEQLAERGVPARVTPVSRAALEAADEIWLTSSTKAIVPVVTLDGRTVGTGEPGPVWRAAIDDYLARLPV